jgi:type I restriction enzyme S subunit
MNTTWNTGRIGDVCRVVPGYAFKSSDWRETGIRVVKIKNITGNNSVDLASSDCVDVSMLTPRLQKFAIRDGDILIAMTGATAGKVGRVRTNQRLLLNQRVAKIAPVEADSDFIWAIVSSHEYQERFFYLADGAAQPNMSGSQIEGIEIPLPPLPIQRRIAGILSAYDDLIENSQRRIKILEEMARRLYREWFVHFRFPGHEGCRFVESPLGEIPKGWEVQPFSALASYVNGYPFKPAQLGKEGKPIIKIKELKVGIVADTPRNPGGEIPGKYHVSDGDVLFSWSADLDAYLWSGGEGLLNQHLFNVLPAEGISRAFCFHALKESMPRFRALSLGATMHHIKRSALDQVCTVVSPGSIRNQFQELVDPMHLQIVTLTRHVRNLGRTRDLLLPRLLSGQIDVEALPEPALTEPI